mgnify:CR=1 FL=1
MLSRVRIWIGPQPRLVLSWQRTSFGRSQLTIDSPPSNETNRVGRRAGARDRAARIGGRFLARFIRVLFLTLFWMARSARGGPAPMRNAERSRGPPVPTGRPGLPVGVLGVDFLSRPLRTPAPGLCVPEACRSRLKASTCPGRHVVSVSRFSEATHFGPFYMSSSTCASLPS